ncbi:MAG: GNAT family N-acetyltransferase [Parcubacteria group bacterium]|jgi:ribosomal protein S18 acetylase RimI-like enzyme
MNDIKIRKAGEEDFPAVFSLIKELAVFEKCPEKVTNSVEQMKNEKDFFQCHVAENGSKEIVGMTVFFFSYHTWVGKSLYFDDLYVKETYRGKQIGKKLLAKIFEIAKEENCKRISCLVSEWNNPAIELYKKYGVYIDSGSKSFNFDEGGIKNFKL